MMRITIFLPLKRKSGKASGKQPTSRNCNMEHGLKSQPDDQDCNIIMPPHFPSTFRNEVTIKLMSETSNAY